MIYIVGCCKAHFFPSVFASGDCCFFIAIPHFLLSFLFAGAGCCFIYLRLFISDTSNTLVGGGGRHGWSLLDRVYLLGIGAFLCTSLFSCVLFYVLHVFSSFVGAGTLH